MKHHIITFGTLFISSIMEMIGSYGLWLWIKEGKSVLFLIPSAIFLVLFVCIMMTVESEYAGKLYALSACMYVTAALGWMWMIEGSTPDRFDIIGLGSYILGSVMIFYGDRIFS